MLSVIENKRPVDKKNDYYRLQGFYKIKRMMIMKWYVFQERKKMNQYGIDNNDSCIYFSAPLLHRPFKFL